MYTEHGSKNHIGGMGQLHLQNMVVHHFETPEAGERDYVNISEIEKDNFMLDPYPNFQRKESLGLHLFC